MKVDYDSEAHSLLFEFGEFREYQDGDHVEELAGGICIAWIHEGRAESIQLLGADQDITPLDQAAERFALDAAALRAAASAALATPDREITIEVGPKLPLGSEAEEAKAAGAGATARSG